MAQAGIEKGMIRFPALCCAALSAAAFTSPAPAQVLANDASDVVDVTLLPGWREPDGTHIAGLKITLAPGWKTYWRAPGDGGVPTRLDLTGSHNLSASHLHWPIPEVFRQNGMRSIGYRDEVIVPLSLRAAGDGPIALRGQMDFGVCDEICLPVRLNLEHLLPPDQTANVETLSAALSNRPSSAAQAQVQTVECAVTYGDARATVDITLNMPAPEGRSEALVLETGNPTVWVSEPSFERQGNMVRATAEVASPTGDAFTLDPSEMRLTVITTRTAVDIKGCR